MDRRQWTVHRIATVASVWCPTGPGALEGTTPLLIPNGGTWQVTWTSTAWTERDYVLLIEPSDMPVPRRSKITSLQNCAMRS
jgi:hypothetical protein